MPTLHQLIDHLPVFSLSLQSQDLYAHWQQNTLTAVTTSDAQAQALLSLFKAAKTHASTELTQLTLDSRTLKQGGLFVSLSSHTQPIERTLSHIDSACTTAGLVLTELPADHLNDNSKVVFIPQLRHILGSLCAAWLACLQTCPPLKHIAAVTGTNGKTTVTQLIAQLVQAAGDASAVMGTAGNGPLNKLESATHTTADALQVQQFIHRMQCQGIKIMALEASSHGLEQLRLQGTPIRVAVFTNLSRDHLDYHPTMQDYAQAKAKLFDRTHFPTLSHAIIHLDDEYADVFLRQAHASNLTVWTYALNNPNATFNVTDLQPSLQGTRLHLSTPQGDFWINSPLLGRFNVANMAAAVAALVAMGYDVTQVAQWVPKLTGAAGRMQPIPAKKGSFIVDYAHTPDALTQVLSSLRPHCQGLLWVVFGCGGDRDGGKRPLMCAAGLTHADRVILTSDNPRSEDPKAIIDDMLTTSVKAKPEQLQIVVDRKQAIDTAVQQAGANDIVVIAGKGHEDYQEINGLRHPFDDKKAVQAALRQRFES